MKLRLHCVVDPMGWLCVSMIFGIWLYNSVFVPKLVLLPHYNEGHIPLLLGIGPLHPGATEGFHGRPRPPPPGPPHTLLRINNCVGEDNHWLFLQLCFYTQVLSLFTLVMDFCQYYYFQPLAALNQDAFTTQHELALIRVSTLMGLVMFGGMSSLFYTQIVGIISLFHVTVRRRVSVVSFKKGVCGEGAVWASVPPGGHLGLRSSPPPLPKMAAR
ncbi:hypothetical protein CRUP_015129 [Coryphaenoides rupestris]|nr:hypothetical protein CRUP_015129 [Coryphaenoides rupestris]